MLITHEDVDLFNSTYLIAAHVLRELRTSSKLLVTALIRKGIHPVLGRQADKGAPYIFRKTDLKDIDLLEVIITARNERDPTGQQYKIISSEQAAAMLGVSLTAIQELIDSGELKTTLSLVAHNGGETALFSQEDVLKLREARMDSAKYVTLTEAARILDQRCDVFKRQWVRTRRITPLSATEGSGKHYFLREEVEAISEIKKKIMPSREAAAMLGVNEHTLYKWTLNGKMTAFSGPHIDGFGYTMYMRSDIEKLLRLLRKKAELISSSEAARRIGVTRESIHNWTVVGKLKPVFGPQVDGSVKNLYTLREIEDLLAQRQGLGRTA